MVDTVKAVGSCLCGAVGVEAQQAETSISGCHCSMCRNWSGGPLLALECGTEVAFAGDEHIATFASSEWAERGFCRECGTHLFYRLKESGQYFLPVGLLDTQAEFQLRSQIFVDEKPHYYNFAEVTKMMTGAEVIALYAPDGSDSD
ncbi:GFA family protein [Motiliproteus coralliicola]|uniref:GFA family protein n=1 Tax=Motiliproteus coralliicola TaxID=2283196 RepID=A0A369WSC1_9GAMM|nr:GFA family protein [Motiliproteus coralliicola]RDE24567.1 GFA family protein [Motiliproteus coralliicola]